MPEQHTTSQIAGLLLLNSLLAQHTLPSSRTKALEHVDVRSAECFSQMTDWCSPGG